MISLTSPVARVISLVLTFSLVSAITPYGAWAHGPSQPEAQKKKAQPSRILTQAELEKLSGKGQVQNPVFAGQNKYDVVYKGVNLFTGNFSTGATDLSFEGGYGIPVNVSRTYNSDNPDEGPLGYGWELSVDLRSTAGGVLKSAAAPLRPVPVRFSEGRPTREPDESSTNNLVPVDTVVTTDASGEASVIQRDVDGVISPPVWDTNVIETEYETVDIDGTLYEVMVSNKITTVDGAVYQYSKHGTYDSNGIETLDGATNGVKVPSNVLKIDWVKDRHGNTTSYTYVTTNQATYEKSNGTTTEDRLTEVSMPGGHTLSFSWNTNTGRITSVTDGMRTVTYVYDSQDQYLVGVKTPATYSGQSDYETIFAYSTITAGSDSAACKVLSSITDPRGLVTTIASCVGYHLTPLGGIRSVYTKRITAPTGVETEFAWGGTGVSYSTIYDGLVGFGAVDHLPVAGTYGDTTDITRSVLSGIRVGLEYRSVTGLGNNFDDVNEWLITTIDPLRFLSGIPAGADDTNAVCAKYFDPTTLNLAQQVNRVFGGNAPGNGRDSTKLFSGQNSTQAKYADLGYDRALKDSNAQGTLSVLATTTANFTYNFAGSPLRQSVIESGGGITTTKTTEFAYWGKEKFFQKKATKDPAGRFSYIDYYDSSAASGKKGQVYRTYTEGISTSDSNSFENTGTGWQGAIYPSTSAVAACEFDYDSKGRVILVSKLGKNSSTRVLTTTVYGADGTTWWGQPVSVTEDAGTGKLNRVTETLSYDAAGRPTLTIDALGRRYKTEYDLNGRVLSVDLVNSSLNVVENIATTSYGMGPGTAKGMPIQTSNNNTSQGFAYYGANQGGKSGQISSTDQRYEAWIISAIDYSYNDAGEKSQAIIKSADFGGSEYALQYRDYIPVGDPTAGTRAFQTLTYCTYANYTVTPTSEEFHYAYDSAGRLLASGFAQTPSSTTGDYYFETSGTQDLVELASKRARSAYSYDGGGRLIGVYHYWDTLSGGTNGTPTDLIGYEYQYDSSKGLKLSTKTKVGSGASGLVPTNGAWTNNRTECYTYAPKLDYLTGVTYGDGMSNASRTWGYDSAGNRSSDSVLSGNWTYDNLNRMADSPGKTYTNDIIGNRLTSTSGSGMWQNTTHYTWDNANRLESLSFSGIVAYNSVSYRYLPNGLRAQRVVDEVTAEPEDDSSNWDENLALNKPTYLYSYDGQMCVQDSFSQYTGGSEMQMAVTQYWPGPRGIECQRQRSGSQSNIDSASWSYGFPLYDGHGNNVATLSRSGSSYTLTGFTTYDVWGKVRSGAPNSTQGYCANLGHKYDFESDLVYMRARYYDPGTGRFISEDPAMDGSNWYVYCGNEPVNRIDATGRYAEEIALVLEKAYAILQTTGRGFGSVQTVQRLRSLQAALQQIVGSTKLLKFEMIADALAQYEASVWMGSASEFSRQLAEAKLALGAKHSACGVYAQIAVHIIDIMIVMVENGMYLK